MQNFKVFAGCFQIRAQFVWKLVLWRLSSGSATKSETTCSRRSEFGCTAIVVQFTWMWIQPLFGCKLVQELNMPAGVIHISWAKHKKGITVWWFMFDMCEIEHATQSCNQSNKWSFLLKRVFMCKSDWYYWFSMQYVDMSSIICLCIFIYIKCHQPFSQ